ncbi:MAG: hypothetical protein LUE90_04385 [Clostridiales bacterium]|nr:hypothetical protein [Clostridiales bacterium]
MACFLVPAAEAVATTAVTKILQKKEQKNESVSAEISAQTMENGVSEVSLPLSRKLKWLNKMLWGGSALLCFEHIWHGEITPYFPFLTAAANPEDMAGMLREMSTVGVSMAALVTVVWIGMVVVSSVMEKRAAHTLQTERQR